MADIELVIKIPDHLYKLLMELPSDSNEGTIENVLMKAVENGTPLPKGHGRLMILSEDKVKKEQLEIPLNFSCQKWINEVSLSNATLAIIEADRESENKG